MSARKKRSQIAKAVETQVLKASRRHCCLCVFLDGRDQAIRGQIAHLNRDRSDSTFENLVWLCLNHHDEYDSRTSQSKGLTEGEVRQWRDELYARNPKAELLEAKTAKASPEEKSGLLTRPWRYPLWQVANQPDLFAYRAPGGMDGVCLIERIDIPDGRIVVSCIQMPGNPGKSITNAVEAICLQVCDRFEIPPKKLVWLEHYTSLGPEEWKRVTFAVMPPTGPFSDPKWTVMTPTMWAALKLQPKKRMTQLGGQYQSKIRKLFDWPTEAMLD